MSSAWVLQLYLTITDQMENPYLQHCNKWRRSVVIITNFIQKETLAQVFSCEVCEISKNTFFYRTTLVVASAYFKNLKFINGILSRYYKIEKNKITHLKLSTKMYRKTSSYVQIDKIMLYRDFIWKQSNKKRISKLFRMQKPLELCHKLRLIFIATL